MKLWLISQDVNQGYETYDSAVVAAEDEESARRIVPGSFDNWLSEWAPPDKVTVKLIGEAIEGTQHGEMCASFNAG